MGTRAYVHIMEDDLSSKKICTIYCHMNGYPTGLGEDIKRILNEGRVTILNGFNGETMPAFFNGTGCMAAYLVGQLKTHIGGIYLSPCDGEDDDWIDYKYTLYLNNDRLHIRITNDKGEEIHNGALSKTDMCNLGGTEDDINTADNYEVEEEE